MKKEIKAWAIVASRACVHPDTRKVIYHKDFILRRGEKWLSIWGGRKKDIVNRMGIDEKITKVKITLTK